MPGCRLSAAEVNILTAAVSLLATAAYAAWANWEKLEEYFKVGIERPAIEGIRGIKSELHDATKLMEGFEKQTRLSLTEMGEYTAAKEKVAALNAELERRKDLEQLLSGKSKAERERASGFNEAVAEHGGPAAKDQLMEALETQADAKGTVIDPTTSRVETVQRAAENMLREAAQGDKSARDAIVKTIQDAFGDKGSFAKKIIEAAPERKAAEKLRTDDFDTEEKALKDQHDRAKEAKAAREKWLEEQRDEEERGIKGTIDDKSAKDKAAKGDLTELARQATEARKVVDAQGKAVVRQDHADNAAAAKLAPGFKPEIEGTILRNRMAAQSGQPFYDEAFLKQTIEKEVGRRLAMAGQDPRHAHDITHQSGEDLDRRLAASVGRTGDLAAGMLATMGELAGLMNRNDSRLDRNEALLLKATQAIRGVRANQARGQNRRPSLLMGIN